MATSRWRAVSADIDDFYGSTLGKIGAPLIAERGDSLLVVGMRL
jgi:hypothetical protein